CSRSSNLVENVTVSNPIRIGTGIGSYVVYTCTIKCPDEFVVRKRYSDFVKLRAQLIKAQPKYRKLIPNLPPKKIVGKFVPEFIEKRRKDMEYFLTYVLLHPVLGTTGVVKWWLID
ncbi:Phox homologous domain-containing protein, partial [Rhizophagus diaphanus]